MNPDRTLTVMLDLGRELIRGGTEVWLVEDQLDEIFDAYGFKTHDMMITSDHIRATVQTQDGTVHTQVREVPGRDRNMERLGLMTDLSNRILAETPEPDEIEQELQKILAKPGHSRIVLYLAAAFLAGNFTMFFNGWRQDVALVALIAIIIMFVKDHLFKREDNPLIANTLLAYLMEVMVVAAALWGPGRSMTSMTAGLIMLLIGGLGLTSGMRDLLHKNVLSGLTDFMYPILGAMGIAIGISLALMTFGQDVLQHVAEQEVVQSTFVQEIASIGGCAGFAIGLNCRGRVLVISIIGSALTRLTYVVTMNLAADNYFTATLAAACVAALFASFTALAIKRPPTIFQTSCILLLLPGSELYQLIYAIIMDDRLGFQQSGRSVFLICLAIALGYIIVEVLFKYFEVIIRKLRHAPGGRGGDR